MANKIALGVIDAGIAGGADTTSDAPVAISDRLRKKLMKVNSAKDTAGRLKALAPSAPATSASTSRRTVSPAPGCRWASTRR